MPTRPGCEVMRIKMTMVLNLTRLLVMMWASIIASTRQSSCHDDHLMQ